MRIVLTLYEMYDIINNVENAVNIFENAPLTQLERVTAF